MNDPTTLVQERLAHNSWGLLGSQGWILGLDLGSYGLRASLVDLHGHTYQSAHREPEAETPEVLVGGIIELARGLMAAHSVAPAQLVRIGAGFGGPVDARRGVVLLSPRQPGWDHYPLAEQLEEALDATVLVDNDANLIALAEATFGVGRDTQHMFYIHLSTGVGGGLVLDGRLYHGAHSTAGEIGHAIVGPVDPIGGATPGTLEEHVSIRGLLRRAAELGLQTDRLSEIFGEHPTGRQIVGETVDMLAARLSQIIALIDPQMVVIGGVVARNGGEPFIEAIKQRVYDYMGPLVRRDVAVVSSILGAESVAVGGVALALESMRD